MSVALFDLGQPARGHSRASGRQVHFALVLPPIDSLAITAPLVLAAPRNAVIAYSETPAGATSRLPSGTTLGAPALQLLGLTPT